MPILDEKTGEEHSLSFLIIHPRNYLRKKYPVVLIRNPYGRLTFFYFFYTLAEVGLCVRVCFPSMRGAWRRRRRGADVLLCVVSAGTS
jgi:hypothetical protein